MALEIRWADRHRTQQADQVVDYSMLSTGREDGQKTVTEFAFRASTGDDWGLPEVVVVQASEEAVATYTPPGAGYVKVVQYTTRDGVESYQRHQGVFLVDAAGNLVRSVPLATESTGLVVTAEDGRIIYTE